MKFSKLFIGIKDIGKGFLKKIPQQNFYCQLKNVKQKPKSKMIKLTDLSLLILSMDLRLLDLDFGFDNRPIALITCHSD